MSEFKSLPPDVQQAIDRKVDGIVSLQMAWRRSCSSALAAGCLPEQLVELARHFESPRSLDMLVGLCGRFEEPIEACFEKLRQRVDESAFSLGDWLAALEAVLSELGKTSRVAAPSVAIGFVHCTAEFVAGQRMGAPLREVVEEMLDQYGFEG